MVIPWDLLIMGQDQLIRGYIAAESEMDAKRRRRRLAVVTDDVYTDIRGAFPPPPRYKFSHLNLGPRDAALFPLYVILFSLPKRIALNSRTERHAEVRIEDSSKWIRVLRHRFRDVAVYKRNIWVSLPEMRYYVHVARRTFPLRRI